MCIGVREEDTRGMEGDYLTHDEKRREEKEKEKEKEI